MSLHIAERVCSHLPIEGMPPAHCKSAPIPVQKVRKKSASKCKEALESGASQSTRVASAVL